MFIFCGLEFRGRFQESSSDPGGSREMTRSSNFEKNPFSSSDFSKISTKKSTSDPKNLKSLEGSMNMFVRMVQTNGQVRGRRIALSNLCKPSESVSDWPHTGK